MQTTKTGLGAFALLVSGLMSGSAFAGTPAWTFSESAGQVFVLSPGVSRAAHRNDALKVGDVVVTGPNGRAIVVRGQEYLVVAPNSRFRIADPAKTGGLTQIVEQAGNIVYRIKKMTTPHFAVQTPYLAAVVKGTTFSVTVNENGATVQVLEGRVEVATRDGGASYMVLPGDIGSVSATAMQKLNVQGRETRQLISPLPPAATPPADDEKVEATPALWEDTPKSSLDGTIVTAVTEGPVKLDAVTDGLVRGDSSLTAVVATAVVATREATPVPTTPAGDKTGDDTAGTPQPTPATATPPVTPSTQPTTTGSDRGGSSDNNGSNNVENGDDSGASTNAGADSSDRSGGGAGNAGGGSDSNGGSNNGNGNSNGSDSGSSNGNDNANGNGGSNSGGGSDSNGGSNSGGSNNGNGNANGSDSGSSNGNGNANGNGNGGSNNGGGGSNSNGGSNGNGRSGGSTTFTFNTPGGPVTITGTSGNDTTGGSLSITTTRGTTVPGGAARR